MGVPMYRTINVGPMGGELEKMPTLEQAMAVCLDKNDDVADVGICDSCGNETDRETVYFNSSGKMYEKSEKDLQDMGVYPESEVSEIIHSVDWECETARWIFIVRP